MKAAAPRHEPPPLVTRSKKLGVAISSIERTRWHKRQRPPEPGTVSKNQQFRNIQVPPHVMSFIKNHGLGRFRSAKGKEAREARKEDINVRDDLLFSKRSVRFMGSAATPASFIPEALPEVAFLGRSNVGKSSLINGLIGSPQAKTSHKPGYTRTINFFELGKALSLVDLPGYGFAYAGSDKMSEWQSLVRSYLSSRKTLKRVCLLIDSRHGLKPKDVEAIELFESEKRPYQVIMTKAELVDQLDLARRYVQTSDALSERKLWVKPIIPCSAHKKQGLDLLRSQLRVLAAKLPEVIRRERPDKRPPADKSGNSKKDQQGKGALDTMGPKRGDSVEGRRGGDKRPEWKSGERNARAGGKSAQPKSKKPPLRSFGPMNPRLGRR